MSKLKRYQAAIEYFEHLRRRFYDSTNETYWGKAHNAITREMIDIALDALYRAKPVNELQIENAQLRAVITENDPNFFRRKCRVCGCDWNHPCNDHDFWVEDNLCSACAHKLKIGSDQSRDETDSSL